MADAKAKAASQEKFIIFHQMRQEQREIALKIAEIESDKTEHKLVVDSLKELDPKRKCFRMVGGVLVERTVGEVLPALNSNVVNMGETLEKLQVQLKEKGKALTEYREKNGIRFHGDKSEQEDKNADKSSHGILVGQ